MTDLLRSGWSLGLVAVIGAGLLAAVHALTAERILEQERRVVLEQLNALVPADMYDNALHQDQLTMRDEGRFPGQDLLLYRARQGNDKVAVVLRFDATRAYNGNIRLLMGIAADGTVLGVRVVSHKETPGLGDAIELPRSDWILSFDGRSLDNPGPTGWAVKTDGGEFDQFTGATITPRAVVEGVERALEFHQAWGEELYR